MSLVNFRDLSVDQTCNPEIVSIDQLKKYLVSTYHVPNNAPAKDTEIIGVCLSGPFGLRGTKVRKK